jgi:hypothetical protein
MLFMESIRALIRALTIHEHEIMKLCDENQFSLSFLLIQLQYCSNSNEKQVTISSIDDDEVSYAN